MSVFYIYVPDGGAYSMDDMEYSPNAENVKRQLACRVRTGEGRSYFISKMEEISFSAANEAASDEEWPPATDEALMVVWRVPSGEIPTGNPTEVWRYSGTVDRPVIIPVTDEVVRKPLPKARVSEDVIARRIAMGWDEERARTTLLTSASGTIRAPDAPAFGHMDVSGSERRVVRPVEVFEAFGLKRTIAEWHELTRISESALRTGARKHGLEEYLRKKQWKPGRVI